ncbi:S8 family serine peptidase, partial [Ilumatobacter sp.]|uniref:S8 family serine peptidase n=1 Tax=Ilumatobacter sp. TaxID=1967498 RepID=UPI003AF706C2
MNSETPNQQDDGMPRPPGSDADTADGMPRPGMTGPSAGGDDPASPTASEMPAPDPSDEMPPGGDMGQMPAPSDMPVPMTDTGADERFPPPGTETTATEAYEPGVVEVEFRDGVRPQLAPVSETATLESRAPGVDLDPVNSLLRRHGLQAAQSTFDVSEDQADEAQASAATGGTNVPHLGSFFTMQFPPASDLDQVVSELNALDEVERAVRVPRAAPPGPPQDEPLVGTTDTVVLDPVTNLENQWYVYRCNVDQAWPESSGTGVVIADIDWGYRTTHQDLAPRLDMANAYNSFDGGSVVDQGAHVSHGTAVMGLAGAAVNDLGMAGIAYNTSLWPIQADSGPGAGLGGNSWARAIEHVRQADSGNARKVIILEVQTGSYGNYEMIPSVNAAIRTAIASGVVVCVAAGNGDRDAGLDDAGQAIPPTGSILVGATGYDAATNPRAWFSNYGSEVVVAAPGDGSHDLTCNSTGDADYRNGFGGTSGATPKVAAVAALLLQLDNSLTHAQIRTILNETGTTVTTDAAKPVGTFLDAGAAVRRVVGSGSSRLDVFVRGGNQAVYEKMQTAPNNGWSGWASLGGWIDLLEVAENADGRLEVFARGSNKALYHKWQTASGSWSGWASMGGWIDRLAVGRNADGRLEAFVRGSNGALYHKWQTAPNNGWSGWASMGGWIDRLAVGNNADGRLEVFVRGSNKALYHKWQTAPNNGWSGWASMGGWIDRLAVG